MALGTLVTLRIYEADDDTAASAVTAVEEHLQQRGRDWYPWADGELNRVNSALAAGDSIEVSAPLRAVLQRAAEIETMTNGAFNPALGALTELWGFNEPLTEDWQPPKDADVRRLVADAPGGDKLRWTGRELRSASRSLMLDPGGIAKGVLLESAAAVLREHGIDNAIIDLGGDLLAIGQTNGRNARIGIRRPGNDDAIGWIEAQAGEAVLTSGNYERYFEHAGRRYHHVLDPQTGYPATGVSSVTVVHKDAALADAAATALLVAGGDNFAPLCAALGIEIALLIDASGDLRLTSGMQSRVHWLDR